MKGPRLGPDMVIRLVFSSLGPVAPVPSAQSLHSVRFGVKIDMSQLICLIGPASGGMWNVLSSQQVVRRPQSEERQYFAGSIGSAGLWTRHAPCKNFGGSQIRRFDLNKVQASDPRESGRSENPDLPGQVPCFEADAVMIERPSIVIPAVG